MLHMDLGVACIHTYSPALDLQQSLSQHLSCNDSYGLLWTKKVDSVWAMFLMVDRHVISTFNLTYKFVARLT
jgi:hypothetical protein